MRTIKTTLLMLFTFCLIFKISSAEYYSSKLDEIKLQDERIKELFETISIVNLLNGINLTKVQTSNILNLVKEFHTQREKILKKHYSEHLSLITLTEKSYENLLNEIKKGFPARGGIERTAQENNHKFKEMIDKVSTSITFEQDKAQNSLEKILSPEQIKVVNEFKPCLIPPKDLKNPISAGQASSNTGAVKLLRRIREIPERVWERRKYDFIERRLNVFSKHHYKMTESEKRKEAKRMLHILEKARDMSDTDFEMEKERIAESLRPGDKIEELRTELISRMPYQRHPKRSKMAKFLLDKKIIPILEERLDN